MPTPAHAASQSQQRIRLPEVRCACGLAALYVGLAICLTSTIASAQRAVSSHQKSVGQDDYQTAIWAPRPGNINNEIVGEDVIPEELLSEYLDLHSSFQHVAAARVSRELIAVCPDRPEGYYNLACSLAQLRRHDQAMEALEEAIDRGWRYLRHAWLDPDLETLRDDAKFGTLMMKMARLEHNERVMPRPLRDAPPAAVIELLETRVPELLDVYDVPGATIALVQDGTLVWNEAFGCSNPHDEVLMLAHDQFELQSPVDLFALLAANQQSERGLDLADLLAQADELDLRERPQRLARGTVPRYVDVDRDLRARLLAHDDASQVPIRERRGADRSLWPISQIIPRTLDWVTLAIEQVTRETFYAYCRQAILDPAGMHETTFVLPKHRPAGGQQDDGVSDAAGSGDDVISASPAPVVIGHTRFGTPLTPVDDALRTRIAPVRTTAGDLARLMASIMRSSRQPIAGDIDSFATETHADGRMNGHAISGVLNEQPPGVLRAPLEDMLASRRLQQLGLGLEVHLDQTVAGPRMQVIENNDGIGMLMRWYPESGNGIVVLFNSENGPEAAIRIAHEALGGE